MLKSLTLAWLLLCVAATALAAEDLEFRAPAAPDGALTAAAMRSLAVRALPVYKNDDRAQFLGNLSALQLVAGDPVAAHATRESLRDVRRKAKTARPVDLSVIYDMYTRARALQVKNRVSFDQAFTQVFRETVMPLDDLSAFTVTRWLATPLEVFQSNLQRALDRVRGEQRISLSQAVNLVWAYLSYDAFRSFGPVAGPLIAADDGRRYVIDDDVLVRTPQRASISAVMVRPRNAKGPLPTLLQFTTYVDSNYDAMDCAAHGYAGVIAYARGRAHSPDVLVPYEHDGDDARAVIAWIAHQKWSNGSVGMYGSGYAGFAAWAAAKHRAPALKALAASSPFAPGLDAPERDRVPGMSASVYRRWLRHPTFDYYWRRMIPHGKDFAHIDIPVLTTTGYFDEREADAMYYFQQHLRHDPNADETLLVGPYDDGAMQRGPLSVIGGYPIDRAALVNLKAVRFEWFDHVLKGGPLPAILSGRINYEVMGADAWQHAPSLDQMANGMVRLYLDPNRAGGHFRLSGHAPSRKRYIELEVPLEDREGGRGSDGGAPLEIMSREIARANSVTFVSGPLQRPMIVSGSVSGVLSFAIDQRRLGLHLAVYELLPNGDYFQLFAPPEAFDVQEAYVHRRRRRIVPGRRERFPFDGERLTSVELQTGARIVLVLAVDSPGAARESADPHGSAGRKKKSSLDVRWYGGSYIELPVSRSAQEEGSAPPPATPTPAKPAPAKPAPAKPAPAKPAPAKPAPAKPAPARPEPAKPGTAKPAPPSAPSGA